MRDNNRSQQDLLNKISRRYLLKNSAIAATGAVLLPSLITGCTKHNDFPGKGGDGAGDPLTPAQLQQAADNLRRLRVWITDLYPLTIEYENVVLLALGATEGNGTWNNFIAGIFIDIAFALAAGAAVVSDGAAAVPAFACLSAILHDWGIGKDRPSNLDDVFADFEFGHNVMQLSMEQKLSYLVDPADNYKNLQDSWDNDFVYQPDPGTPGKHYTIGDLASSNFPDLGDDYNTLQTAAFTSFKKSLWNLAVVKVCSYSIESRWTIYVYNDHNDNTYPYHTVTQYAQQIMYPQNKGRYLRAVVQYRYDKYSSYELQSWNLGVNGGSFSEAASNILFMDDTPTHIINPAGLFNRSYVFEQFTNKKPTFLRGNYPDYPSWHELGHDPDANFWQDDDWNYTCGSLPSLIAG